MKVQRAPTHQQSIANCRHTLRVAIAHKPRRRNWVQIVLCGFGMAGLASNIAATGAGVVKAIGVGAGLMAFAKLVFLFFWLAAQIVFWLIAVGVLGRLVAGRALTIREAADGMLMRV